MWFRSATRQRINSLRRRDNSLHASRRPLRFESLESRNLLAATMLKDVAPNSGSSNAANFTDVGNLTYFTANDNSHGVELWKTDGTTAGTTMVTDIAPGAASSAPQHLTALDGKIYFTVNDQVHGRELWVSDGTPSGTQLILDIDTIGSSSPDNLVLLGDYLVFSAYDQTHGRELWVSDGTTSGTVLVADLQSGTGSSNPNYLTLVDGAVFFAANNTAAIGNELWKYEGPGIGASLVRNIADLSFESSNPQNLTAVGDKLYFSAVGPSDFYFGRELYISDGTSLGTYLVKDVNPGTLDSNAAYLTDINGTLWFRASSAANGNEVWTSDGTSGGTNIKNDYDPGAGSSNPTSIVYGTAGVFVYYDAFGYIIYYGDNSSVEYRGNGLFPNGSFTSGTDYIYYSAAASGFNYELWQINKSTRQASLVQEICPGSSGSYPSNLEYINGAIYFTANDGTNGTEPWTLPLIPIVSISGLPSGNTGPEGTAINVSANITSPGAGGPYTYAWSVTKQGAGSAFATGTNSTFSFTPDDNTTYNLSLTVTDSLTQQGTVQEAIVVTNMAPTATIVGAPTNSSVGTQISLTSTVTDPGALDTTFTYAWTVMRGATQVATGTTSTLAFTPTQEGTYDVTFTATDDDTGADNDQKSIQITYSATQNHVVRLYDDLLGRVPDPAGLQYWTNLLTGGTTRGELARAIMASGEYRQTRISAIYQQYLGRAAEGSALIYCATFLANGGTELDFKAAILTSAEYGGQIATDTLFIQALYQDILGRAADSGGETFWLQALAGSNGPATVVTALLRSRESFHRLVEDAYQLFLSRAVDNSSADYWLDQLMTGGITFDDLFARIADSNEYGSL